MRKLILLLAVAASVITLAAAESSAWTTPFAPHKIAGNLYYVGTTDLACFLVTTPQGHILINTGLQDSTPLMRASITKLGFKLEDVKILLNMQAHYDHVAAMEEIRKLTGAKVLATEGDAGIMESGGKTDPHIGIGNPFTPIKVDRRLKNGEVIRLGGSELKVIETPGHTKGSVSYQFTSTEGGRKTEVLLANMQSVVMPLVGNKMMPNIVEEYERAFKVQKALKPRIWVAAHASQYDMERKLKAGSFVDPDGYAKTVAEYEQSFRERLAKEHGQPARGRQKATP